MLNQRPFNHKSSMLPVMPHHSLAIVTHYQNYNVFHFEMTPKMHKSLKNNIVKLLFSALGKNIGGKILLQFFLISRVKNQGVIYPLDLIIWRSSALFPVGLIRPNEEIF